MVFLIKLLVAFIKNLIALAKFGKLDEYASDLQEVVSSLEEKTSSKN